MRLWIWNGCLPVGKGVLSTFWEVEHELKKLSIVCCCDCRRRADFSKGEFSSRKPNWTASHPLAEGVNGSMKERQSHAWVIVDSATVPTDGNVVRLYRRGEEFAIRVESSELMASGVHGSEDALAKEACLRIKNCDAPRLLIGGLGMGYTLAAALGCLGADAEVVVAEIVPAVVLWNRGLLAHLAGAPLEDSRVRVLELDVALALQSATSAYDAILLDVDNGPRALTSAGNGWLYSPAGLDRTRSALAPGGILAVWSAWPDRSFTSRLRRAGFHVEQVTVRSRGARGGRKHVLWLAGRQD